MLKKTVIIFILCIKTVIVFILYIKTVIIFNKCLEKFYESSAYYFTISDEPDFI